MAAVSSPLMELLLTLGPATVTPRLGPAGDAGDRLRAAEEYAINQWPPGGGNSSKSGPVVSIVLRSTGEVIIARRRLAVTKHEGFALPCGRARLDSVVNPIRVAVGEPALSTSDVPQPRRSRPPAAHQQQRYSFIAAAAPAAAAPPTAPATSGALEPPPSAPEIGLSTNLRLHVTSLEPFTWSSAATSSRRRALSNEMLDQLIIRLVPSEPGSRKLERLMRESLESEVAGGGGDGHGGGNGAGGGRGGGGGGGRDDGGGPAAKRSKL